MPDNTQPGPGQAAAKPEVSRGLNLTLELQDPNSMVPLLMGINRLDKQTKEALRELHFVHFARFLPYRGNVALLVITEFDGPFDAYVLDFAIAIGDVFDWILQFVKDHPPLPVRDHPREFLAFVKKNNRVVVAPPHFEWDHYPVYSSYPQQTVLDILGKRTDLPPPLAPQPPPPRIDLDDIQGNILRGYNAAVARHFALRVPDPVTGRGFLDALTNGNAAACPQVTTAAPWPEGHKPGYTLNVGVTAQGLAALGVPEAMRNTLPEAYLEGPAAPVRAADNGDVGASAPENWVLGGPGQAVHLLVSLFGFDHLQSAQEFPQREAQLRTLCANAGIEIVREHEARALPGLKVHFGYTEGMAEPRIAGVTVGGHPDMQPEAGIGEFLLGEGYLNVYGGKSLGTMPPGLCHNAAFAAVRVMEQDVAAFEKLLDDQARDTHLDRDLIAAKMMGRARDGKSLSDPGNGNYNEFDYAPSQAHPNVTNDHEGLLCPVGSHIRRMNPRSARVAGRPHSRRLIRRGMPYGPEWDGNAAVERGLFGLFICADLDRQFEFLIREWANGDVSASGIRGSQDPIIGRQDEGKKFSFPVPGGDPVTFQVPRLVKTRGSLYLLLPGIGGLKFLAAGAGFATAAVDRGSAFRDFSKAAAVQVPFDPSTFSPKDPAFLADPYPYFAQFRRFAPVAKVGHTRKDGTRYESYWVFTHDHVTQVCDQETLFLKRPSEPVDKKDRGLFYMEAARHAVARPAIDPLFLGAIAQTANIARNEAALALADIQQAAGPFDLITAYSNRVTRNVFMSIMGIPPARWQELGDLVQTMLVYFDQMLSEAERQPHIDAGHKIVADLYAAIKQCPAHPPADNFLCQLGGLAASGTLEQAEVLHSALHFALGGYLSTDFLIGTGIHNLLTRPGAMEAFRATKDEQRLRAIEELKRFDAPFQGADRFAAQDTSLAGVDIPAGARVTVMYGSANHDETKFGPDADTLNLERDIPPGLNYVFGHGIHYCIGAPMVANVAPVVFDALLAAMPNLALAGRAERYADPYFRGFARLEMTS